MVDAEHARQRLTKAGDVSAAIVVRFFIIRAERASDGVTAGEPAVEIGHLGTVVDERVGGAGGMHKLPGDAARHRDLMNQPVEPGTRPPGLWDVKVYLAGRG